MRRTQAIGTALFALAVAALAWAGITVLSGGFVARFGGVPIASRDPLRPCVLALVLLIAARLLLGSDAFARRVRTIAGTRRSAPARVAALAAAGVLIVALAWSTRASGGSDSSCYLLQAESFAHGHVALQNRLARDLPDAPPELFAPTGWIPSRVHPPDAVPICGPGLSLFMAAPIAVGWRSGAFLIVPLFAAAGVWLTFLFGRALDEEIAGAAGAILFAVSPIVLFQAVQPMSDVPAAVLSLAALVLCAGHTDRRTIAAGFVSSLGILTRANLLLPAVPLLFVLRDSRARIRFALSAAPAIAAAGLLNAVRYGTPFASGYGDAHSLFDVAHLIPNLARYPRWVAGAETPLVFLGLLAPALSWPRWSRRVVVAAVAAVLLLFATYLAYSVFDDWWYIRFLLPALPILLVLTLAVVRRGASVIHADVAAVVVVALVMGGWELYAGRIHRVLAVQSLEARFVVTGQYAARALPLNAVVLAVQQSGSVRYHGRRETIAWGAIAPGSLDATIESLARQGHAVFIALEDNEEPVFRTRFGAERFGRLDWPPRAEVHTVVRVRVYSVLDRDSYFRGAALPTEHVR